MGDVERIFLFFFTTKDVIEPDNRFSTRSDRFVSDDAFYYLFQILQGAREVCFW